MPIHAVFDLLAATMAFLATAAVYQWRLRETLPRNASIAPGYAIALVAGAAAGGYLIGTANLWLSGISGVGRSIIGALAGAILAIEFYKARNGITSSTGLVFVPGFVVTVAVGRIGCLLSGLEDQTHGIPSSVPWAMEFGDGIPRHPVQAYESIAMALFLAACLFLLGRRSATFLKYGFYIAVLWYASQRFVWEFLKPYGKIIGPLNIFHFVALGLVIYAAVMIWRAQSHERP